jgi:hypothetical protein
VESVSEVTRSIWSMRRSVLLLLVACSSASSAPPPGVTEPLAPVAPLVVPAPQRTTTPPIGNAATPGRVALARIVTAIDGGVASDRPAYARRDQRVMLHALLGVEEGGKRTYYSDAKTVQLDGKSIAVKPLAQAPQVELRWNRIEPAQQTMSNGDTPKQFHFETIDYRATPIEAATNTGALAADVHPTLTPDHGGGVGTMRFQLVALQGERVIASPGPEARRGKGSGGVSDAVTRVSLRRDDSYLGFLTEMYGQPYIWASAGITDRTHQSERLEGSDCADFIVYGQRRMGRQQGYMWTGELPRHTTLLAAGTRGADGVYRDTTGKPLPFTRVGDVVLFPRHTGVLAVDQGTIGVLDDQDLMMHTLFDSPKEQRIADTGYADKPLELRRWR